MPPAPSTASVTSSPAVAVIGAIWTWCCIPTSTGPITASPPSSLRSFAGNVRGLEARHDQHVGRAGEAAERVDSLQRRVERDVGRHLSFIFEVDVAAPVHQLHRVAHALEICAFGIAEDRVAEEGDARLLAHAPGHMRGMDRDLDELLGRRPLGHRRVGDEDGVALARP
jgi:hypothetical protein